MKQTGSLDLIKRINRNLILDLIRRDQPISRSLVAKTLGISRSTVSHIVDDLLAKKFVVELGLGDSTKEGGRRGIELGFNPESAYGVGVEIGDRGSVHLLTDLDGNVIRSKYYPLTSNINEFIEDIKSFLKEADIDQERILGLGIAVPSIVDSSKAIVIDAPLLGWENVNLKNHLVEHFDFPIFVHNDVNSAALGESWLGSGKDTRDIFFLSIGSGVGSAIISDSQLILGHSYSAGEIGYLISMEDIKKGYKNEMGAFGIFERNINKLLDTPDKEALGELTTYISIALANVVSLLNPEKIVIGGFKSPGLLPILKDIQEQVSRFTPFQNGIEMGSLNENAAALGAINSVFNHIFQETI